MRAHTRVPLLVALVVAAGCRAGSAEEGDAARTAFAASSVADLPSERPALEEVLQAGVADSRRTAIVTAAERVSPAVISINVSRRERVVPRSWVEQFFVPPGLERDVSGLGSGFIIRADGLAITNEHVVRDASQVVVTLPDGREFDAAVVGTDEVNDLALLRLDVPRDAGSLPVAPLGSSDDLMIGEWVVAIGNPFGYALSNPEPSVTAGVVSATGRNIMPGEGQQRGYYLDMIQTDASINPGNSGGPLVNALGEVVGVNSSILSSTGGNEGLGFAIPIDRARRIALALADQGRYRRAWIGAQVEAAGAGGLRRGGDVRVAEVVPGSPAERAGLRRGMVVRAIGRKAVRTPLDWEAGLLNAAAGESLDVRVDDGGRERLVRVQAADLPSLAAERTQALRDFQLVTLTPAIRAERGLRSERGALIVALPDDARRVGLREGDLIVQINRLPVQSADQAAGVLQQLRGQGVVMYFERGGRLGSAQFLLGG
jgi:serine protease Do